MELKQLIKQERIQATATMVDTNPNMPEFEGDHWKVVLRNKHGRQLTVPFSMGYGLSREPEAADVLDCLASDAGGIENARSFEEWASEYGYDEDSRKAERVYKACEKQAAALERFMGEQYETLLWNTERL